MGKLDVLTSYFDGLREESYEGFTEDEIFTVLTEMKLSRFQKVVELPQNFVSEAVFSLAHANHLDFKMEQEIIEYFKNSMVNGVADVRLISKCLRYLLRKDTASHKALIIIDVQNDFISGNLALKNSPAGQDGEEVVDIINYLLDVKRFHSVYYTLDWHKEDHCSFVHNVKKYPLHGSFSLAEDPCVFTKVIYDGETPREQILWPSHCVQNSEGANLHPNLKIVEGSPLIYKGQDSHCDSYSAFWDNSKFSQTELLFRLLDDDIHSIYICGLALDYCVGFTSLDGVEHGFDTFVILDACRGVCEESIKEMTIKMEAAGVKLVMVESLLS